MAAGFPAAWPLGQQWEEQGNLFIFLSRSASASRHVLV